MRFELAADYLVRYSFVGFSGFVSLLGVFYFQIFLGGGVEDIGGRAVPASPRLLVSLCQDDASSFTKLWAISVVQTAVRNPSG